jgi:lipopolysaccharide transport system ATP-binding protein
MNAPTDRPMIEVRNLSKLYQLGGLGLSTLREAVQHWWSRWRGRNGSTPSAGAVPVAASRTGDTPNSFWALRDVSFDVQPGEVVGILGRNGAGKSTLLKLLSRITDPTSGRAVLRGRVASLLEVGTGFHPDLTGRENVFLNGAILGMKHAEITAHFDEIVDFAEIAQFIDTPVKRYSSGMYMRLAFAVAAYLEAEVLLVDEVLAVGDAAFQKKCMSKMDGMAKTGRTVLFVSHNLVAMEQLCHRCVYIADGRVREVGPAKDVIARYQQDFLANTDSTLQPDKLRSDGRVTLNSYHVTNGKGQTHPLPVTQETVEFHIRMTVHEAIAHPACGISVWNRQGVVMLSVTSADQGIELPLLPEGEVEVVVRLRDVPFTPGKYTASFWVMSPQWHIYAVAEAAISFEIGQGGLYGTREIDHRWGCVYVPIDYSWEPSPVTPGTPSHEEATHP